MFVKYVADLDKLEPLTKLSEISLVNNPVTKRLLHRPSIVSRMPNVRIIDGVIVTEEERTKAELYSLEQQVSHDHSWSTIQVRQDLT